MLYLDSPLPALPSVWSLDEKKVSPIAERLLVRVEPVGFAFERLTQQASLVSSLDNESETATTKKKEDNDIFNKYFEPLNLVGLNPSSWKKQDHYEILGLHKLRYLATEENINRAYKALVLKHHPDKKKKLPDGSDDDSYFKCLKIAHEWLSDSVKRRSYDSVDPAFDDYIPEAIEGDFFETFAPVFERNAKFSIAKSVPKLGTLNSSRNEIEKFYNFWYKFKSWREFSYLDEEDVSKATNREEKRWLEKKNKNERARRKKEENQRILKLVDTAFKLDPRVKLFKEMERKDKEAARQTKLRAAREGKLKAVRGIPDCKPSGVGVPKKAMVERRENQKALDTARKKQRENFLNKVKSVKFFCAPEVDFKQHINNMQRITKFAETVAAEKLEELIKDFNEMDIMLAVSEAENTKQNSPDASEPSPSGKYKRQCSLIKAETAANRQGATHVWTSKELELLFKALKKFPSGSLNRWKNIQDFITTRCEGSTLQEKDIERSKAFYQEDRSGARKEAGEAWTLEQQRQLEAALLKYKGVPGEGGSSIGSPRKSTERIKPIFNSFQSKCMAALLFVNADSNNVKMVEQFK